MDFDPEECKKYQKIASDDAKERYEEEMEEWRERSNKDSLLNLLTVVGFILLFFFLY